MLRWWPLIRTVSPPSPSPHFPSQSNIDHLLLIHFPNLVLLNRIKDALYVEIRVLWRPVIILLISYRFVSRSNVDRNRLSTFLPDETDLHWFYWDLLGFTRLVSHFLHILIWSVSRSHKPLLIIIAISKPILLATWSILWKASRFTRLYKCD